MSGGRLYSGILTVGGKDVLSVTGDPTGLVKPRGSIALDDSGSCEIWKSNGDGTWDAMVRGRSVFAFSWATRSEPYLEVAGSSWEGAARFLFPGTNAIGEPTLIRAQAFVRSGGTGGGVRLVDLTHGDAVIASVSGIASTHSGNIVTLDISGAFPADEAVFELQLQETSGKKVRVGALLATR